MGSNKGFTRELATWMRKILLDHGDVYFVTHLQVIQWMQNPSDTNSLRDFAEWKEKCDIKGQAYCSTKRLSLDNKGVTRRGFTTSYLYGMSQQLTMAFGPY